MKFSHRILTLGALILALQGCHSSSTPDGGAGDVVLDANFDTTPSDTLDDDVEVSSPDIDASPDGDAAPDGDAPKDTSGEPLEFDASLWEKPNPCEGETSFPDVDAEFFIPDRSPADEPKITRNDVIADLNGLPLQASSIRVAQHLEPGDQRAFELFANPGTDVQLHVYAINNYEDLSSFRLNVVVMVDYEPIEATYEKWGPERTQKLLEVQSTGLNIPITSDVEIIDITIPGSAFSETRMYEVSLNMEVTTIERAPFGEARRFALFNGGYDRRSRPCVEPRLTERATSVEDQFRGRISDDVAALFFEGISSRDDLRRINDVRPGEKRRMFLSVIRGDIDPEPTVLVPLLNGKPLVDKWWVTQGGERLYERAWVIDARKTFEVTFPEEPGIYEVQVASWTDPFDLYRTHEGERVDGVSNGGGLRENSNTLRFRVVDEQSE